MQRYSANSVRPRQAPRGPVLSAGPLRTGRAELSAPTPTPTPTPAPAPAPGRWADSCRSNSALRSGGTAEATESTGPEDGGGESIARAKGSAAATFRSMLDAVTASVAGAGSGGATVPAGSTRADAVGGGSGVGCCEATVGRSVRWANGSTWISGDRFHQPVATASTAAADTVSDTTSSALWLRARVEAGRARRGGSGGAIDGGRSGTLGSIKSGERSVPRRPESAALGEVWVAALGVGRRNAVAGAGGGLSADVRLDAAASVGVDAQADANGGAAARVAAGAAIAAIVEAVVAAVAEAKSGSE